MLSRERWLWVGILLPALAVAETPQDFSGDWVVADPGQAAAGAVQSASPSHHGGMGGGHAMGGGGMGGGRGGGGMGGGGRHRSAGAASDAPAAAPAADAADPRLAAQALTIRQSDVVFDVAADGRRTVYRFDNRNNYAPAYGGTVTLTWAAPEMIVETHPDSGGSIEEHYTLSEDGRKLSLRIRRQRVSADSASDVTRVFVRRGAQEASASTTLP